MAERRERRGRRQEREARAEGPIVVYGVHPVRECLTSLAAHLGGARLALSRADGVADELRALAEGLELRVETPSAAAFEALVGDPGANHQGVALTLGPFPYVELEDVIAQAAAREQPRVLVLDQVQDPHNLGALLRSAAAFGVCGAVLPRDRSASVTAVAIRVSAGGAFHVPVARVTNLARSLDALREAGFWIYGADAGEGAIALERVNWSGAAALVFGAEGHGLRRLTREKCDALVRIPIHEAIDSLNVSVAAGIVMYAASRGG